MKKGYIYITSSGYDPERGKRLKDPTLGGIPSLGACMPNIRRQVVEGDHIFVISGKVRHIPQYVIGEFEVAEKISHLAAFKRFPTQRLRELKDGDLSGNIIVNGRGQHHKLDDHGGFEKRIENYIVGRNPIALTHPIEIARGREQTVDVLRSVFRKLGTTPIGIIGRCSRLDEEQILELQNWLLSLKVSP